MVGQEMVVAAPAPAMGVPPPTSLAPGFRFHPTDEELVRYYLRRKACGKPFKFEAVVEIDVYKFEPWELAEYSSLKTRDLEWYFFSPVDKKYGNGARLNRATGKGYWKATGKDRAVLHKSVTIGMKKTLVFHSGRAPDGQRTNWVMHEYRLCDSELASAGVSQDSFVLCRIFQKSGLGPPNGDRYAPFIEEEWHEDAPLLIPGGDVEDDTGNDTGDGAGERVECSNLDQDPPTLSIVPFLSEKPVESPVESPKLPSNCKRERSEELSFAQKSNKRPMHEYPNCINANGSEDSTTTSQNPDPPPTMMMTTNLSPSSLEFPLVEPKENHNVQKQTFDSSNLEKAVPPGYLKFISNLENEILNVSMERETLKIELMRAQAMINILQSRVEFLTGENDDLRRRG